MVGPAFAKASAFAGATADEPAGKPPDSAVEASAAMMMRRQGGQTNMEPSPRFHVTCQQRLDEREDAVPWFGEQHVKSVAPTL